MFLSGSINGDSLWYIIICIIGNGFGSRVFHLFKTYQFERVGGKMKYSRYIDLDNLTIDECISIYGNDRLEAIINDGKLVNFEGEKSNE